MKRLVALALLAPLQVQAIPITSTAGTFDVTTIEGTFDGLADTLMAQVWWGDQLLAFEFAGLVKDSLGMPNGGVLGPLFAHSSFEDGGFSLFSLAVWCDAPVACPAGAVVTTGTGPRSLAFTFAVARPVSVPEPATLSLLGAGLIACWAMRRRRT